MSAFSEYLMASVKLSGYGYGCLSSQRMRVCMSVLPEEGWAGLKLEGYAVLGGLNLVGTFIRCCPKVGGKNNSHVKRLR